MSSYQESYQELYKRIRQENPLIHCISNIVSANACANLALAVGTRPMMAQAPEETAEIAGSARAVVLNLGTPSAEKYLACREAGRAANIKRIPVVIDPVGAGASRFRREETAKLLEYVTPSLLRVNFSEALALLGDGREFAGVDSVEDNRESTANRESAAKALANKYHCTVLLSGETDLVTDGKTLKQISGGSARMKLVTGTGCMLSVLCGCMLSVEQDVCSAAAAASAFWKDCGAAADTCMGIGSYAVNLIDMAEKLSKE